MCVASIADRNARSSEQHPSAESFGPSGWVSMVYLLLVLESGSRCACEETDIRPKSQMPWWSLALPSPGDAN
jgi:hypothetical protein